MGHSQTETKSGPYTVYSPRGAVDVPALLRALEKGAVAHGKGRRGILLFPFEGKRLALRWYSHGGLFRAVTGELFWGAGRMIEEMETTLYLREQGFRVVEPFCGLSRGRGPFKKLGLVTVLEEGATEFLDALTEASGEERKRLSRDFARALWELVRLNVYHPDLHLRNVLVRPDGTLAFLDFDRARRKNITRRDVEAMFWRLYRYVDKMARNGHNVVRMRDILVFVTAYRKLSGLDLLTAMRRKARFKKGLHRLGWLVESFLYGGAK